MHEHKLENIQAGGIDGTAYCSCGWSKYTVYPNVGGRRGAGIRRHNGMSKRQYIERQLTVYYAKHVQHMISNNEKGYK